MLEPADEGDIDGSCFSEQIIHICPEGVDWTHVIARMIQRQAVHLDEVGDFRDVVMFAVDGIDLESFESLGGAGRWEVDRPSAEPGSPAKNVGDVLDSRPPGQNLRLKMIGMVM